MILACHLTQTHRTTSLKCRAMKASTISKILTLARGYFFSQILKYKLSPQPCNHKDQERVLTRPCGWTLQVV